MTGRFDRKVTQINMKAIEGVQNNTKISKNAKAQS